MGFRTREIMSGTHQFRAEGRPEGRHRFEFRAEWGPDRLRSWLDPRCDSFLWQELHGEVFVGGLCDWTPCHGTLRMEYWREHRITYTFDFEAEGRTLRYVGTKENIRPWNLQVSHTTLFGTIVDLKTNELLSSSIAYFDMRHLPRLLFGAKLIPFRVPSWRIATG